MTANDMIDLLVARLVRDHGKSKHHWRKAIGPIRLYSATTHPHCNWSVTPSGTAAENDIVERIADDLRAAHPILVEG